MRVFLLAALGALIVAGVPVPGAHATGCVSNGDNKTVGDCCDPGQSGPLAIGAENTTYYLDSRKDLGAGAVWLYEETNGIDGLQRGGYDTVGIHDQTVDVANGGSMDLPAPVPGVSLPPIVQEHAYQAVNPVTSGPDASYQYTLDPSFFNTQNGRFTQGYDLEVAHVTVWETGRWDGCFDQLASLPRDTNVL
jgi:hypothetical protein